MVAGDAGEMFALLEGGVAHARAAFEAFVQLYGAVREPWLTKALVLYHARTGSARVVDLLARAPDQHVKYLLDALYDMFKAERNPRQNISQALALLAPLVARRPPWMHRLTNHAVLKEVLRVARAEREPLPLLHALLTLAALLPSAPNLAAPLCPEITEALLRPGALEPPPPGATRAHLQLAQLALFHAMYATHPCTLVETLRHELSGVLARAAWERDVAPLLSSVRLHPGLVTGSRLREAEHGRWARVEPHDVLAEARRLSVHTCSPGVEEGPAPATPTPEPTLSTSGTPAPSQGSTEYQSRAANSLRPGGEGWFMLAERCGAESAPATPLPAEPEPEPEAAVEATPENTPARDARAAFRFPTDSTTVRAIGRRESPPGAEALSARLARVARDRRAADSPVAFGRAPPPSAPRPEPQHQRPHLDTTEDQEVFELTERAAVAEHPWAESAPPPRVRDPRRARAQPAPRAPSAPGAPRTPPRRAASCVARLPPLRTTSVAVQTVDTWPQPYEFIIADFYRNLHGDYRTHINGEESLSSFPCERLDLYLSQLYAGLRASGAELGEQLSLAHAALMYERWRRDSHAERNRRLLGRVRQVRALELQNAALKERARAAVRERDSALARRAVSPSVPPPPASSPGARERELEQQLADERAARMRAEAALHESETARARDAAELQRARALEQDAARQLGALLRGARGAEQRADAARRLRRELLLLAERERRLAAALSAARRPAADPAAAQQLRAALVRAEAELEAVGLRAEQASARAAELEAAAGARDAALAELRRAARLAADQHDAQLRALHDKYAGARALLRGAELHRLQQRADAERRRAGPVCAPAEAEPES
ncbi:hamartin [Plodia interpunctella]|uniref:hamartin n=1 Tax=Plodia interpunctella TaxID=58824 RepID=UPI002367A562|nr:hamartin [Plodia interpunctella]